VSTRRAWRHFEVALTGPFLTGQPLEVTISGYDSLQRRLGSELGALDRGWGHDGVEWQGVESYGSGGGYTSLVPLVLVRREGPAVERRLREIVSERPAAEREWLRSQTWGWRWDLHRLQVDLYDFGVGVLTGTYRVRAPAWLSAEATRRQAESVGRLLHDPASGRRSPVAAAYDTLARESVAEFTAAVSRRAAGARRETGLDSFPAAADPEDEWGRLLWLHSVFVLTSGPAASRRRQRRLSRPFEVAFSESIEHWHGSFAPGIDSSVAVLHENTAKQRTPPMRLTEMMSAFYGLFMEIDRGLLALLDESRGRGAASLAELEAEAARIFGIYMRVQEARSRLDSALADLAGGQLSIWNAIARVQKFDELVAGVDAKVTTLQSLAERRVQQASAARARRTGNVLSGLTALTVVTLVVTAMGSLIGTRSDGDGHVELRIAVIVAAFALAAAIFRLAASRTS
jgi:hypothetical protein